MTYIYDIKVTLLYEKLPFRSPSVFPLGLENMQSLEMHFVNTFAEYALVCYQLTYIVGTFSYVRADCNAFGLFRAKLGLLSHQ
jgi:hypothetical protein